MELHCAIGFSSTPEAVNPDAEVGSIIGVVSAGKHDVLRRDIFLLPLVKK
jgi:hypothetical protein